MSRLYRTFLARLVWRAELLVVRTGDEALDGLVLVGIKLPWRVAVDFAVNWQVPVNVIQSDSG